jgi:cellulose synthase/poly-beta-1,6-N-acetylglucosamine synthase-like glycosyltransferase
MNARLVCLTAAAALVLPLSDQPAGTASAASPTTIHVPQSGNLQDVLNAARPGQTILLEPGSVYVGPFTLPDKPGNAWITIRPAGDAFDEAVPPGVRATPGAAGLMPKIIASHSSAIRAEAGAHHYRFIGLEVAPAPGVFLFNLIDLGTDRDDPAAVPHHFAFERMYIHGDPARGGRRGVALNSAETSIVDSYISDFKEAGFDSQAICGWNGPGPFDIENNYLEGAGENLMFGGADPTIQDLVPSDIRIRRNHFAKPLSWRAETRPAGQPEWTVKNLLELKNARRVSIEGNLFEHVWPHAQVGFAVLFTPRNQDGASPWSVVEDVVFAHNIVRHVAGGINILGWDDIHSSRQTRRIHIANNLFNDVGGPWRFGRLFQLLHGTAEVVIDHNTAVHTEVPVFAGDTLPHIGFVFEDNIVIHNEYGFIGSNAGPGNPSIARYFPGGRIRNNAIVGGRAQDYPMPNFFPSSIDAVGFVGAGKANYRLSSSSPLKRLATDRGDIGADLDAIARAMAGPLRPVRSPETSLAARVLFWGAIAVVAYTYFGYPLLMWVLGHLRPRLVRSRPWRPAVSIVVVAYNEARRIRQRVENLIAQCYPADRREIVVVSDGSTDETGAEALAASDQVRVIEFSSRRGKAAVFNEVLPSLRSEIVVLADARQRFDLHAIEALVAPLADPDVGAVSGELVVVSDDDGQPGSQGTGRYWSYEKLIRKWESLVDSSVGVTGAIAAFRRRCFEPLPPDTILDDLFLPLRIIRRGYRVTFEPLARAYDRWPAADKDELARKVRTLTGNFQLFARERWLLNPWRNRLWLQTVSHKALRLVLPICFAAILIANVALIADPFYQVLLAGQVLFYGLAVAGAAFPKLCRRLKVLVVPYTICFLTVATVAAFVQFLRHRQSAAWEPTAVTRPV